MLGMIRNDLGIAILHNRISRHYQSNAGTVVGHPEGRQFMIYDIYASSRNSFSAFFRIMKPQCLPSILINLEGPQTDVQVLLIMLKNIQR